MVFYGYADGLIATRSATVFYMRAAQRVSVGIAGLRDWFRLYLVPGMQHVADTSLNAPWHFAQPNATGRLGTDVYSTPDFEDSRHDVFLTMLEWVEHERESVGSLQLPGLQHTATLRSCVKHRFVSIRQADLRWNRRPRSARKLFLPLSEYDWV
jgi:hypothetical protein